MIAKLNRYGKNHMTHKAENISIWPFLVKVCNPLWLTHTKCCLSQASTIRTIDIYLLIVFCSFANILWAPTMCPTLQFSHSVMSDSLRPHESQHARPPCPSPNPGVHSDSRQSSQWCHPAISSSVVLFSSCPQSLPASESFPVSQLFAWGSQSTEFQLQHHSLQSNPRADLLQNGLVGSPCSPRDSQESSPTPQFKSISSLALSLLHSPTLTSIHDHWKNHSLD